MSASIAATGLLSACRSTADRRSALGLGAAATATLIALIDEIIPAASEMPAASQVGTLVYWELLAGTEAQVVTVAQTATRSVDEASDQQFGRPFAQTGPNDRRAIVSTFSEANPRLFAQLRTTSMRATISSPGVGTVGIRAVPDPFRRAEDGAVRRRSVNARACDVETLPGGVIVEQEPFDVLVVGSGAAGAAVVWQLTERGARVVCLEQGDWVSPGSFPSAMPTYESSLMRGDFHWEPNVRRRAEDYPITTAGANPPTIMMFNGVGGTTLHWQAHFPRFHPSDFRVKSLDGVADDWPIRYEDLAPYYELNDRITGVSGLAGDPANPPRGPRQTAPLPLGQLGETLARGFDALGWHW